MIVIVLIAGGWILCTTEALVWIIAALVAAAEAFYR
jgi:hypothetical protein